MRSARRPVITLGAAALASSVALSPLVGGIAPVQAGALPADTTATSLVQVTMTSLRPLAPQAGAVVTVHGELRNTSSQTLPQLSVQLRVGLPITSRNVFDTYADDSDGALPTDLSSAPALTGTAATTAQLQLPPGGTEPFTATLALGTADLPPFTTPAGWQVRPLGIAVINDADVTDTTADTTVPTGTVVGQLRSFLPWAPKTSGGVPVSGEAPTQVAWIWPVDDWPHHNATGGFADTKLAPELATGGRLARLVTAADTAQDQRPQGRRSRIANVPVTWAIDPMLVSDAAAMSAGYKLTSNGKTTTGPGSADAKTWLSTVRGAVQAPDAAVLPLPYADPDVVAAARKNLVTDIGQASTVGQAVIQHDLAPTSTLSQYAWPPNGFADDRAVDDLSALGDTTVVLSDAALPVDPATTTVTPDAHTEITTGDTSVQGILTDSVLSSDINAGAANPADSALALQRYLAETLMIQQQKPSPSRAIVIAPSRRWNPSAAYATAVLADSGKVPWIQPVSLADVAASTPTADVTRGPLTYPQSAHRNELAGSYLHLFAMYQGQIASFSEVLDSGDATTRALTNAEQEALSSGWRSRRGLARQRLNQLGAAVATQIKQVRITSNNNSYVTLTSHGGTVPVTIENNLDSTAHVILKVSSQRLSLPRNGRVTVAPIPPHQQTVVEVKTTAKTSGVFPVTVQLLSPDGKTYGSQVKLFVRSTVYGTITLIITGAATAALMIAVAIRLGRRAVAARRRSAEATA
jgi:hypothetical protein